MLEELSAASGRETPTLIHCAHGKDRTGVVVAMVLHVCGVDAGDIAQDDWCFDRER